MHSTSDEAYHPIPPDSVGTARPNTASRTSTEVLMVGLLPEGTACARPAGSQALCVA